MKELIYLPECLFKHRVRVDRGTAAIHQFQTAAPTLTYECREKKIVVKLCNQIKRAVSSITGIILWQRFCYC